MLYELSRFTTLGSDPANDIASASAMLAGTMGHDAVAVWQLENDRLSLRAAAGYDAPPDAEMALDEADTTLATVVREKKRTRQQIGENPA